MPDRSAGFLQDFPVTFHKIDTSRGDSLDRDDKGVPIVNGKNINIYRQNGTDNIVKAMQELTQNKFVDDVFNTYAEAGLAGPIQAYQKSIEIPTSIAIAETLIKNSQGAESKKQALQALYKEIVLNGLAKHFPIQANPALFNLQAPNPPPGFATLITTQIVAPPVVPPTTSFKDKYDGFSSAEGFEFDSPDPPEIKDSNYENEYPEKENTEGSGSATTAGSSIVGQFFDEFIKAVDGKVQLLHQGVTPTGTPITAPGTVSVLI